MPTTPRPRRTTTVPIWSSSPRTATPSATPGCASSASRIWRSHRTSPAPRAGGDASNARWAPVEELLQHGGYGRDGEPVAPLAFDHAQILADGVERARSKIEYSSLATAFCPTEFTVGELRRVYEAVWGVALDPRNFHRKVTGTPGFLVPTGGTTTRQGGRPAQLFRAGGATLLNPPMLRPEV